MAKTNSTPLNTAPRRRFETALRAYRQALPLRLAAPRPRMSPQPPPAGRLVIRHCTNSSARMGR